MNYPFRIKIDEIDIGEDVINKVSKYLKDGYLYGNLVKGETSFFIGEIEDEEGDGVTIDFSIEVDPDDIEYVGLESSHDFLSGYMAGSLDTQRNYYKEKFARYKIKVDTGV